MHLSELNTLARADYMHVLGGIFEHTPWVAERVWALRPFRSLEHLHAVMLEAVASAGLDAQLALLRAHPELAGSEARGGALTRDSSSEQGRLGFDALAAEELARMQRLNREYREKFGFPCIIALRVHASRETVLAEMERRLTNTRATEIDNGLAQIAIITRGRLERALRAGA